MVTVCSPCTVELGGALVRYNPSSDEPTSAPDPAQGSALMVHLVKCEMICKCKIEQNVAKVESSEVYNTSSIYDCGKKKLCVCVNIQI